MSAERRGNRGEDEVSREEVGRSHVRIKANMSKLDQSSITTTIPHPATGGAARTTFNPNAASALS